MSTLQMIMIVCPLVFFASFVDAIAGGGGLISLPAYLFTGMPTHLAYGSNKFSSCLGTIFSTYRFFKNGAIHLKVGIISAMFAIMGSTCGAKLTLLLSDELLKITMMILLPLIAFFTLFHKRKTIEVVLPQLSKKKMIVFASIIGFFIGMYDGFFGPGTGTFLIISYTTFMHFDITTACGNAKIVNLSSNFAALSVFLFAGEILYAVAIPAAMFSILGHWIGSGLALKNGEKYIRPVMIFVLIVLFLKIIVDFFL